MDGREVLKACGKDFEVALGDGPNALCRSDEHGWLGLTGEKECADLNMACVLSGASAGLLKDYVREITSRQLDAIVVVEAVELAADAVALGLQEVGAVPVMVWHAGPAPVASVRYKLRPAESKDVPIANALIAEAFSLDEDKVQRAMPASTVAKGADLWIAEEGGEAVGCGVFVRTGDHAGIYCMATPERNQRRGIGRAVIEGAMAHYVERGVTTFTLEATEAGYHLYEQVGFATVATPAVYVSGASTQFPG